MKIFYKIYYIKKSEIVIFIKQGGVKSKYFTISDGINIVF